MVIVALVWWFLTRNEETTDDAFTDGDVVTIAPKRQATSQNFAYGITSA